MCSLLAVVIGRCPLCVVRRASCCINNLPWMTTSFTPGQLLLKLHSNIAYMTLYQNTKIVLHQFKIMADRAKNREKQSLNDKSSYTIEPISIKLDFREFLFFCVCVSKGNPFWLLFYSTVADVVPCEGRKQSLPVHHHSAGYILFPLGSLSSSWSFWKSNTT